MKSRAVFVMLAAPLDVFGLIVRNKSTAYRLSAVCKQLRAQVRSMYSIQKTGGDELIILGPHRKWVYHDAGGMFWLPTWTACTNLESIVYDEHECTSCADWYGPPHIDIDGAYVHPHELAFAVSGDKITMFDAVHTANFIHAAQYFGAIYKFIRVEYSNTDPGGVYLGIDNRAWPTIRGGDKWKIVLARVHARVYLW